MKRFVFRIFSFLLASGFFVSAAKAEAPGSGILIFENSIQPVFAENCFSCHGTQQQTLGLRLDKKAGVMNGGLSGPAVIPGDSKNSLLFQMISGAHETLMPPEGGPLPEDQINLIKTWIDQGAHFEADTGDEDIINVREHWAYQPVQHPKIPTVKNTEWVQNPIDAFVLKKLEDEGVSPSPRASKELLIRRLYLDITGLLPSPQEVAAFVNSDDPDAYEQLVDRLLASQHYGERWGRHWLDLARYADSDGYEKDRIRPYAWRYRDWVIDAFNNDMPFDRFTVEQIAGDLLPDPSIDQLTATGFHRMTLTNTEGGVDQEEFRIKAVKDRVNTTSTVWLGLTMACAECHTHKYDPITHKEYYQFYSFFNTAEEKDIKAPFPDELARYETQKEKFDKVHNTLQASVEAYRQVQLKEKFEEWLRNKKSEGVNWKPLNPVDVTSTNGTSFEIDEEGVIKVEGKEPGEDTYSILVNTNLDDLSALRLEVYPTEDGKAGPGRAGHGNFVLSEFQVFTTQYSKGGELYQVPLKSARADHSQNKYDESNAIDGRLETGWAIGGQERMTHSVIFDLTDTVQLSGDVTLKIQIDQNYGNKHTIGRFRLFATNDKNPGFDGLPYELSSALNKPERTEEETNQLMRFYEREDPVLISLNETIETHNKTKPDYPGSFIMGFTQPEESRKSFMHVRGDFLRKGDRVEPGVIQILHPIQTPKPKPNRLDLAYWLVSPDNPLTSRVAANRVWQYLFGEGIVRTPNDFGVRGDKPTHPELLDWLANQYIRLDWSRKALIKTIVMSNTYQQASLNRADLKTRDPQNYWLARQNRYRLSGEIVRDISLDASGLLSEKIGGPSIRPPLPSDVAALGYANSVKWKSSEGEDRYRRGLYIFFQRTVPYPMLVTFDAPEGTVTETERERSNTPLQALTILNDPVFFECAQHLGLRIAEYESNDLREKIRYGYQLALSRAPSDREVTILANAYQTFFDQFKEDRSRAEKVTKGLDVDDENVSDIAAYISLGRTLINVEEFFTRQ